MNTYLASINIMPHKELLDPQGKTLKKNMPHLDLNTVQDVRVGKRIEMRLEAENEDQAKSQVETACKKLLANVIMESYEFKLEQV